MWAYLIYLWVNIDMILATVMATHAIAIVVVNMTPTPADDRIVYKFYRFVEMLAGVVSNTAKERPGERRITHEVRNRSVPDDKPDILDRM